MRARLQDWKSSQPLQFQIALAGSTAPAMTTAPGTLTASSSTYRLGVPASH